MPSEAMMMQLLESMANKRFGKYRGVVTNNDDPKKLGRLEVKVKVLGETTIWADPCSPFAGADVGFFMMPPVGTFVWVEFEAGDINHAIWTGFRWTDGQLQDPKPSVKFIKTEKFTLMIDDQNGEITIENSSGSQIVIGALELRLKSSSVISEASNGRKIDLSAVSMSVNNAALEVL